MSKELTKKETNELTTADMYGTGFEDIKSDELIVPYLKILQVCAQHEKYTDEESSDYIEGLKPGEFFGTPSNVRYGKTPKVIILNRFTSWLEKESKDSLQIVGVMTDEEVADMMEELQGFKDGFDWYLPNGNYLQETKNFFLMFPDHLEDGISIFSMKKGGIKHYKKWFNKAYQLHKIKGRALWDTVWEITTKKDNDPKSGNSWYAIGDKNELLIKEVTAAPYSKEVQEAVDANKAMVMDYMKSLKKIKFEDDAESDTAGVEL